MNPLQRMIKAQRSASASESKIAKEFLHLFSPDEVQVIFDIISPADDLTSHEKDEEDASSSKYASVVHRLEAIQKQLDDYPLDAINKVDGKANACIQELGHIKDLLDKMGAKLKQATADISMINHRECTRKYGKGAMTKDQWRVIDGFAIRLRNLEKRAGYDI